MSASTLWPWLLGGAVLATAAVALSGGEESPPAPSPQGGPLACAEELRAMPADLQRMVLDGVRAGWTAATPVPTTVEGLIAAASGLDAGLRESLCRAVRQLAAMQG